MTLASARSVALIGVAGTMVEVEAATASGLPRTILVGLPDTSLYEARDRCRAAVASAGLSWPAQALTINLTPACLPKAGTHFDLAIAAAALAADEVIPTAMLSSTVLLGELGLDGRVRPVRGVLPALLAAREAGFHRAVVPRGQAAEARLVEGMAVTSVGHLSELIDVLHGRAPREEDADEPLAQPSTADPSSAGRGDFSEVIGQLEARHAMEVAAAGRHHIVLRGAPGCGKSMLAARLPTILPPLDEKEALEVTAVHSLMGNGAVHELMTTPPLSEPHHSVSMAAMVGGGARVARPGAVSLAHRGVLFLDEAPEFPPRVLDALRGPLENGYVTICRSQAQTTYPARFQLVMALNPCPCGLADDRDGGCRCTPQMVLRYASRISGPILDRVDIHQRMRPLTKMHLVGATNLPQGESSRTVGERVQEARHRAARRWAGTPWRVNAEVPGSQLRKRLPSPAAVQVIEDALARRQLTARGVDKVLRIAWTEADLAGCDDVTATHIRQAMALRQGN